MRFQRKIKDLLDNESGAELLKGSAWALILRILGIGISYAFVMVVTHMYGARTMGIFALCQTLLMFSVVISKVGMDKAFLRFSSTMGGERDWDHLKMIYIQVFQVVLPIALLISCGVYFYADEISTHVFNKPYLAHYFRYTAWAIVPMALMVSHSEGLRGLRQIKSYLLLQRILPFLVGLAILLFLKSSERYSEEPLVAYLAAVGVSMLVGVVLWVKRSSFFKATAKPQMTKGTLFKIALPMFLSGSMFLVMNWTDTFLIGVMESESDVGIYNVAYRAANLATIGLFAINSIAAPQIASAYNKGDTKEFRMTVHRSSALIFWSTVPIVAGLMIVPEFLMEIFGTEFGAGATVLVILAASQLVNALSGSVMYILQMTGHQNVGFWIILVAAMVNLVLNLVLIPEFGIQGAAFASLISMVLWNFSCVFYIKRKLDVLTLYIPPFWKR